MPTSRETLTTDQVANFQRDGMAVISKFYDEEEIEPIQRGIYEIIEMVARRHEVKLNLHAFDPKFFDSGYQSLIAADRQYGAEVYDAVKRIPAFVRLSASVKHDGVFRQLRPG